MTPLRSVKSIYVGLVAATCFISAAFIFPNPVKAEPCPNEGVVTKSCTFSRIIDGVDAGTGSTNTTNLVIQNAVVTITAGQKIAAGSFTLSTGGSIVLPANGSGELRPDQPLYMMSGYYDPLYPANQVPSLTPVNDNYKRMNTFGDTFCKPAEACPTACGQPSTVKPGSSALIASDQNGNCLSRTCAATAACCGGGCCGQPNGTQCSCSWTGCYNDPRYPGMIVARYDCGNCSNQQCSNVQCQYIRGWPNGTPCHQPYGFSTLGC